MDVVSSKSETSLHLKNLSSSTILDDIPVEFQDAENLSDCNDQLIAPRKEENNMNVVFLYPGPRYVLQCVDQDHPSEKVYVNICSNENVGDVVFVPMPVKNSDEASERLRCSVPSLLCQPKFISEENDKRCQVFDVMFHPNTFERAESNDNFKKMINVIAVKAIKSKFSLKLSDTNIKNTTLKYKGTPGEFILRTKIEKNAKSCDIPGVIAAVSNCEINMDPKPVQPKYVIRHRSEMSLQDFTVKSRDSKISTRPKELIADIELPLVTNMASIKLDVTDKKLKLTSTSMYFLEINLPYLVDEAAGKAEFNKDNQRLTVTLPVVEATVVGRTNMCKNNELASPADGICSNKLQQISDFINDNDLFQFPLYNHFQTPKEVVFKLHVPNVDPKHVKKFQDSNGCAVLFESRGSSSIPIKYSFCLKFPKNCCIDSFELELSSTNVLLKLKKEVESQFIWEKFEAGLHSSKLSQQTFLTESSIRERLQKIEAEYGSKKHDQYEVRVQHMDENEVKVNLRWKNIPEPIEEVEETDSLSSTNNNLRHSVSNPISIKAEHNDIPRKVRSMSESSKDDIVNVIKRRGILKMPRSHIRRTMSESSDEITPSSPDSLSDFFRSHSSPDIAEEEEEEYSTEDPDRPKKTVRFLDKVSENIFRSNCSIIGQRKKNQKRTKNKKKHGLKKTLSDSGNSSCSDMESATDKADNSSVVGRSKGFPNSSANSSNVLIENTNRNQISIDDNNNNSDGSIKGDNDCNKVAKKKKSRRGRKKNRSKKESGGEILPQDGLNVS